MKGGVRSFDAKGHAREACLAQTANHAHGALLCKQEGISFLLIDMNAPGVDVQPTKTPGDGHEAKEMFFSRVFKSTSGL